MDHVFGSRWLINELSQFGFSISYDEVNRYKQSVIQSESLESLLMEYFPGTFTQWVADNVDHNVASLDGNNSLHGMGIIAISTPKNNEPLVAKSRLIHRQRRVKVNELVRDKGVPILQYVELHAKGLSSVFYKPRIDPYTLCHQNYFPIYFGILDGHSAIWKDQEQTGLVLCSMPLPAVMNQLPNLRYFFYLSFI